jgi:hypothetical protein
MAGMGSIARLAIFAAAAILTVLGFLLPALHLVPEGTARLPGGLAKLASPVALALVAALAVSAVQVMRGHRSPAVAVWTAVAALLLAAIVAGIVAMSGARAGAWTRLGASALALLAHSRLLRRFDAAPVVALAPALPQPIATPPRPAATLVRAAEIGHAGIRITTDAGDTRMRWDDILRVQLITGLEPGVELTTREAILRFNRKTTADYRFLPGATDGTAADNLRRLYDYARERNPGLRLTP